MTFEAFPASNGNPGAQGPTVLPMTLAGLPPWVEAILDELDHGLALLLDRKVIHLNYSAVKQLAQPCVLTLSAGQLVTTDPTQADVWLEALHAVETRRQRRLLLPRSGVQGSATSVALVPLDLLGQNRCACLVIFGRSQVCEDLSVQGFARQHALTGAEARVLQRLRDGESPRQIAGSLGVRIATIRTQIASIRAKTGAADLRSLLSAIARLPPLVGVLRSSTSRSPQLRSTHVDSPSRQGPSNGRLEQSIAA